MPVPERGRDGRRMALWLPAANDDLTLARMVCALRQHRASTAGLLNELDTLGSTGSSDSARTFGRLGDLLRDGDHALQALVARLETSVGVRSVR
jgi:hypothetical protein